MVSFLLVAVHTGTMQTDTYGGVSLLYAWLALFNVLLAFGMETAFFRFFNTEKDKNLVVSTALIAVFVSSLVFLIGTFMFRGQFSNLLGITQNLTTYVILILVVDALTIVPFAWLRAKERPILYSVVKLVSVGLNFFFNVFFLSTLPKWAQEQPDSYWAEVYIPDFQLEYVFIANLIGSLVALILVGGRYFENSYRFDFALLRRMLKYAYPVMLAGIAFTINEVFDRILLDRLLPPDIARSELGKYSACYKLAVFMTLFGTAFRLGVEPFFFSHAKSENPQKTYAQITKYFVMLGGIIFLAVLAFADPLKKLLVRDEAYWEALDVVPIILLAAFCLGVYHNFSVWYKITDRTKFGAYISSIGAVLTLAINFLFIPKIGYMASAWATLIAYATMMVLSYYFGKKYYPIPYNLRKMFFYGGISILFAILTFYVFNRSLIVGSLLLLLFLGLIYKLEGDQLKTIFIKREN